MHYGCQFNSVLVPVVSFAGGKKDPSDRSVVDTALREAGEELGIHVTEDQVWGVMKPLRDMVSYWRICSGVCQASKTL